jgi:hypothetical protein
VQIVDDFLANSEADVTFDDAIVFAIKKTRKKSLLPWLSLSEEEQKLAKKAAKVRYRRGRNSH